MKNSILICALAGALCLASCNNDDGFDFNGKIDDQIVETLTLQHESTTYELKNRRSFDRAPGSDKWNEKNLTGMIGGDYPGKSRLVFIDGKLYMQPEFFCCAKGPHPVIDVWYYYLMVERMGSGPAFFVRYPDFAIDRTDGTITLEQEYTIGSLNTKGMTLYLDRNYVRFDDMADGTHRWCLTYAPAERIEPDGTDVLFFESAHELYGYILDKVHTRFGDVLDKNYWQSTAIFDRPHVDIAGLIAQWEAGDFDDPDEWIVDHSIYY